ncbi:MAG: succinate dehydrogenase, cytochrome b556 subunit [Sphingobium sp.]|nr:succinate dehydrogenase, cytochrome b556 subunit [Sphingobium sp.]
MAQPSQRPLSPHITIWKWGPHMLVSILHRATGDGLAILGGLLLLWWLYAVSAGSEAYGVFRYYVWHAAAGDNLGLAVNILGKIVLIGLSWAFIQHMFSGLRHFVMDIGAGYELNTNKRWSVTITILSVLLTVALWAWLLVGRA